MREPFGFISYRTGPSPQTLALAVGWSLVIILAVTVGATWTGGHWRQWQRSRQQLKESGQEAQTTFEAATPPVLPGHQTGSATPVEPVVPPSASARP